MTRYTPRGTDVYLSNEQNDAPFWKELPAKTYLVGAHPIFGFYLTETPSFDLPKKIYGDTLRRARRFLNTFADRPAVTGVLLSGTKGSGKSLAMKLTSILGLEAGYPTLIISSAFCGDGFNQFVQSISQPCIIIFDEFEKIYNSEQQESLLTLLDGTISTKKLVIMTCNNMSRVDSNMTNRPGRVFYYLKYSGVSEEFIREYCADRLNNKDKIQAICTLSAMFYEFNFDMLQAIVEESNRYPDETIKEVVDILNVNYESFRRNYDIKITMPNGKSVPNTLFHPTSFPNPFEHENISLRIYGKKKTWNAIYASGYSDEVNEAEVSEDDDEEDAEVIRQITIPMHTGKVRISSDLSHIEAVDDDLKITFVKQVMKSFSYDSLIDG